MLLRQPPHGPSSGAGSVRLLLRDLQRGGAFAAQPQRGAAAADPRVAGRAVYAAGAERRHDGAAVQPLEKVRLAVFKGPHRQELYGISGGTAPYACDGAAARLGIQHYGDCAAMRLCGAEYLL